MWRKSGGHRRVSTATAATATAAAAAAAAARFSNLVGRESLIRLIGKRRRTLFHFPQNSLLLSNSQPHSHPLPSVGDTNGNTTSTQETAAAAGESDDCRSYASDWVECPVCGSTIRGNNYVVNSHLDSCLARGTKRKLTQSTLLQLSFFSESSNKLGNAARERILDANNEPSTIVSFPISGAVRELERNQCTSLHSPTNMEICNDVPVENIIRKDAGKEANQLNNVDPCLSLLSIKENKLGEHGIGHARTLGLLDTFIVGRRFHDKVNILPGAKISILRDPENTKDRHAIKVLYTDSGCQWILGYLPRELAKYLSPLMENYHLTFEGSVTSLPNHSVDVVPIQLVCEGMLPNGDLKPCDIQIFESLWGSVLRVVEDANFFPPNMTRYQRNFHIMVQEVLNHHAHLFTDEEFFFLGSFKSFSDDSQRIFIRLYTRKGPWFRMSNVSYPEVLDLQKAIEELQLAGYVYTLTSMEEPNKNDMKEILDVLTVFELREISMGFLKKYFCTKKQEVIHRLSVAYEDGTCPMLPSMILEHAGTCVKISKVAELLLWRVQRLFFLNGEQDLSAFLLVDLGLVKFPSYSCNVSQPIFQDRSDLLAYEEAVEVAQIMDQSLDENNMQMVMRCIDVSDSCISTLSNGVSSSSVADSLATFLTCFSASWVYSKVVTLGVSVLEMEHRYEDAIKLLKSLLTRIKCDGRRGYWTLRLTIDLEHVNFLNESLLVAEEGILDPWVRAGSKIALQRRVIRLGKPPRRWKMPSFAGFVKQKIKEVHVRGRPLNCETGAKNRYYGYDGQQCSVEQLALQYYAGEGGEWQGTHTETGIWLTIFGLLMWDVIFADIPDVFQTRFQTAPLDLDTDSFYVARKCLIESHLQKIEDGMAEEILIVSWESHEGTTCRGVNWDRHSLSDLRAAVSCIGGHCLASFCRHLAQDYRSWSSGMPDLLLWRFHGEDGKGGEAKLVEVKGPTDRLSEQQQAWMLILMDCGFNTEVCKVSPTFKSP